MNRSKTPTALELGNLAFRQAEYETALEHYQEALHEIPEMASIVNVNIKLTKRRLQNVVRTGSVNHNQQDTHKYRLDQYHSLRIMEQISKINDSQNENPSKDLQPIDENLDVIIKSGLFKESYYIENYPDVASSGVNPIEHYCNYGWREQRNPNGIFNTHYYLAKNQDVATSGMNPFVHWLKFGQYEGRKTNLVLLDPVAQNNVFAPQVLFVSHEASQTGAPAVLLALMRWFKSNTNVSFAILIGASGPWNDRFQEIAPCFFFDDDHEHGFEDELRRFCGSEVQAVYVNTIAAGVYAKHLDYLDAEIITHVHEMENLFKIFAESYAYLQEKCTKYIAVSQGSVDALKRRINDRAQVTFLKPFIDRKPSYNNSARRPTSKNIIYGCGAVERRKGFDLFCEVAAKIASTGYRDFKMYWIGSADKKDLIPYTEIHKHNVGEYVEWLGPQDNAREFFTFGDIFLLPSREDPYPLVCMEAAECEMPIICFSEEAGGMHSFVESDAGVIVDYLDTTMMANSVIELLHDREKLIKLGKTAAEKVAERHYVEVVAPSIFELFPKIASDREDTQSAYYRLIDAASIVSFDIFDTLVTRRINEPAVAFDLMEHRHTEDSPAVFSLLEERMRTAGRVLSAHAGRVDDISIEDIYAEMSFYRDSKHERDIEVQLCTSHPLGLKLYNYARKSGKKIYIASDMYLDQQTIEKILKKCGILKWDKLFLSSSLGKKKDTGKLFTHMLDQAKKMGYAASDIFHIGDNWLGDVKRPKHEGIITKRFVPINERPTTLVTLTQEAKSKLSQNGRIWNSFCTQATRLWHEDHPELASEFYTKLGFELTGPLASMMAMMTADEARRSGVRKIVFMARDGRIIKNAFDTLYSAEIANGEFQSDYLHLSRATVVPATFTYPLSANDIAFLSEGLHLGQKTIRYFVEKAGLSLDQNNTAKAVFKFFDSFDYVPTLNDSNKVGRLFDALSQQIFDAHADNRNNLENYLKQKNFFSQPKLIIVDVGWLLNIHSRLAKFSQKIDSNLKIIGCYVGSRDRSDKGLKASTLLFEKGDPYIYSSYIEQHTTLFEVLFSAPEPSAKGLKQNTHDEFVSPVFKPIEHPLPDEFIVAQKLHMGAEFFFDMLKNARKDFFPECLSKDFFFEIFKSLVQTKSDIAKATLGAFEVRLGGHHEFVSYESLIAHTDSQFDYEVKQPDETFEPIAFSCEAARYRAIIVSSAGLSNGSTRYRAINLATALQTNGTASTVVHAACNVDDIYHQIIGADIVIFQRCFEEQGNVGEILRLARLNNKICIGEIDDLVFPEHVESIGSVVGGEWRLEEAIYVAAAYEKMIKKMDSCVVSTPLLKSYIESTYKKPCQIVRNRIQPEHLKWPTQRSYQKLNILYSSGTYSHKADFMMIEDVLYKILTDHPSVKLSILGAAQASERILSLNNVQSYPLLPYTAMLDFISKHDLLLIPLEDTIFNRAKSTVKFVESSAVGVPVLASSVGEFSYCISHNSTGLLAKNIHDWKSILLDVIKRPKQLKNISKNANQLIRSSYLTTNACLSDFSTKDHKTADVVSQGRNIRRSKVGSAK